MNLSANIYNETLKVVNQAFNDNFFYKQSILLILGINFFNIILFSWISFNVAATLIGFSAAIFLLSPFINAQKNNIRKKEINIVLLIQTITFSIILPSQISTLWFFLISSLFTLSMFQKKKEIPWKNALLGLAGFNFIFWNFYIVKTPIVALDSDSLQLVKTFFQLEVFVYTILNVIFWTESASQNKKQLDIEHGVLKNMLDSVPIPIFSKKINSDSKITYSNQAAKDYCIGGAEVIEGMNSEVFLKSNDAPLTTLHRLILEQ